MDKGHKRAIKVCTLYYVLRKKHGVNLVADVLIKFNYLLFMCRVNGYKANYRHNTV
jgi:hypothetical protein